jgi:hypothetical protein
VSVASEYDHAEQVVADVAILQDMAEGRLDDARVKEAAQVLLEHKRHELPSVSVAVAARLLGVSRTIIESWREAGVLTSVPVRRRRYRITIESIVRVQALLEELRRLGAAGRKRAKPEWRQAVRRAGWSPSCCAGRQSWGRSATMTIRLWSAVSGRPSSP